MEFPTKLNLDTPAPEVSGWATKAVIDELHAIEAQAGLPAALAAAMGFVQGLVTWCEDATGVPLFEAMAAQISARNRE